MFAFIAFLFTIQCFESIFSLFVSIVDEKYKWGRYNNSNIKYIHFRDIMAFIVYPVKDFLIAMSFTSIYYYYGIIERKEGEKEKKKGGNINLTKDFSNMKMSFSDSEIE